MPSTFLCFSPSPCINPGCCDEVDRYITVEIPPTVLNISDPACHSLCKSESDTATAMTTISTKDEAFEEEIGKHIHRADSDTSSEVSRKNDSVLVNDVKMDQIASNRMRQESSTTTFTSEGYQSELVGGIRNPKSSSSESCWKFPEAGSLEFVIEVGPCGMGLRLAIFFDRLVIVGFCEKGAVSTFNRQSQPGLMVQVHDYIVSVNGMTDPLGMKTFLQEVSDEVVVLRVSRPVTADVCFCKQGFPMNCEIKLARKVHEIHIWDVGEGAVSNHNEEALPWEQIRVGDRIFAVNETARDLEEMIGMMGDPSKECLALSIIRAPF